MFHILKRYKSNIQFLCNHVKVLPNDIKLNILGYLIYFVNYINVLMNRNGAQIFFLTTVYKYSSIKMTES